MPNNPYRVAIQWYTDYTLFPNRYVWRDGDEPFRVDALANDLFVETISPKDGELSSEELAAWLESLIKEHGMVSYTAEQLKALARQIRNAKSKVEQFAYTTEPARDPWLPATAVNGTDTPWGDRRGWAFRANWKLKSGETEAIWLWLTKLDVVEV